MSSSRLLPGSSRKRIVILGAVAALMLAAAAWWVLTRGSFTRSDVAASRVNLLLVTIDTLRADRTGGGLTPSLNRLAGRGARFLDARTPAPLTLPAHTSLMTGLLPPRHGVRMNGLHRLAAGTPTLATLLSRAGYHTAAFVGAYVLDPRFGLGAGFDTYDAEIPRRDDIAGELEAERRGGVVADRAIAWLNAQQADAPLFLWVHLYDPHAPYDPPAPWLERAAGQPYDGEVAYADAQLGRLLDALTARALIGRTLVIVAGDHGESLGDHGEPTHGLLVYEKAVRVPLVFAGPGVPRVDSRDGANLVDVVPTAARLLGLHPPPSTDGRMLFNQHGNSPEAESYFETEYPTTAGFAALHGIVAGRWKFIGGAEPAELYDLAADPGEQNDLSASRASIAVAMAARVQGDHLACGGLGHHTALRGSRRAPSCPRLRRLDACRPDAGCRSPFAAVARRGLATIPGGARRYGGQAARPVRPRDGPTGARLPGLPIFQASYGRALEEAGRAREALGVYRAAVSRWSTNTSLLQGLATAARSAGLADEALKAEQAVLAIDPTDAAAENGIGLVLADRGRPIEARDAFRRAIALDPHVVSYWVNLGNACRAAGQPRDADDAYRRALALDDSSVDAMNGIAVLLVQSDHFAEAATWLERAVARSPGFYEAWLNLGIARQEQGNKAAAAEAYRRVLAAPAGYHPERDAARKLLAGLSAR